MNYGFPARKFDSVRISTGIYRNKDYRKKVFKTTKGLSNELNRMQCQLKQIENGTTFNFAGKQYSVTFDWSL